MAPPVFEPIYGRQKRFAPKGALNSDGDSGLQIFRSWRSDDLVEAFGSINIRPLRGSIELITRTLMNDSQTQSAKTRVAWRLGYLVAAAGIYLVDQSSKAWAVRRVRFADLTVIKNGLDFVYAENPG